jgi:hypothetical protein
MQNQRIPKQTATTTMEGTKKGRTCKGRTDEIGQNLNIMGIKTGNLRKLF